MQTHRQTRAHARAGAHKHAHTGREKQRQGDTERLTERRKTGDRHGREDGVRSDRHTGTDRDTPQREALWKKQLPQGRGRQPWARRAPAGRGALGLAVTLGSPRLPLSRGLKGPIRLGYLRQDSAPTPRPEGECVRVRVCECVGGRVCVCARALAVTCEDGAGTGAGCGAVPGIA